MPKNKFSEFTPKIETDVLDGKVISKINEFLKFNTESNKISEEECLP
jgi:hypothetical protein